MLKVGDTVRVTREVDKDDEAAVNCIGKVGTITSLLSSDDQWDIYIITFKDMFTYQFYKEEIEPVEPDARDTYNPNDYPEVTEDEVDNYWEDIDDDIDPNDIDWVD